MRGGYRVPHGTRSRRLHGNAVSAGSAVADAGDVVKATKLINGGTIGLEERKELYEEALEIFG